VLTDRYWVYENGYLRGPFHAKDLAALDGFTVSMKICQDGDHVWRPVHDVTEIAPLLAEAAHSEILASGDYMPECPSPAEPLSPADLNTEQSAR
jgi:hypothetical protein